MPAESAERRIPLPTSVAAEGDPAAAVPAREGVALCLSGGGFRAALFHLGALRRLDEAETLSKVRTITSVSGGSILAAHLAESIREFPASGPVVKDWEKQVAAPFRRLTRKNLRRWPTIVSLSLVFRSRAAVALEEQYRENLTKRLLIDLPESPQYRFCATDEVFGVNWIFGRERVGDYQAGYCDTPANWPVARAVAASSCFPILFKPMHLRLNPRAFSGGMAEGKDRDRLVSLVGVSDGGVYDNMGTEPVWKSHAFLMVSDGGSPFSAQGPPGLLRSVTVNSNQARALRRRWLIEKFDKKDPDGMFWGIGSKVGRYPKGPSVNYDSVVDEYISQVRTDLDSFSDSEARILENHGYMLADAAVQSWGQALNPVVTPFRVPHPDLLNPAKVKEALAESHINRIPLGRG
jgi:NTE family protein